MGVVQASAGLRGMTLPVAVPQAVRSPLVMTAAQVQVSSSQPRRQQTRCNLSARPFNRSIPSQKRTAAHRLHPCRDRTRPAPDTLPDGPPPAKPGVNWDRTTRWLVDAATVPFIFLLVPQVMKNAANLSAGNAGALAALSWVGYSMALAGNSLLFTYFVGRQESSAALIQGLGVVSNFTLLVQIHSAGYMPNLAYYAAAVAVTAVAVVNLLRVGESLSDRVWSLWGELLGLLGVVFLTQALYGTMVPTGRSDLAAMIAGGAAIALFVVKRLLPQDRALQQLCAGLLGWTATLMFMFQPLAQLVRNLQNPATLAGVSLLTVLLATAGNALMVPRALCTRDAVWLTGSSWGAAMGWAQVASLFFARTPGGGVYIGLAQFTAVTVVMAVYATLVVTSDLRNKKNSVIQAAPGPA